MAQNVSSVRVAIQGDARGLNAELIKASKAVTDFGGKTNRSSVKGLDSQLSQVRRQLNEVAEQYVTGGKIQRTEIEKLVELEKRLKRQIEARNTALSAARREFSPLEEISPGVAAAPVIDRQLTAIQRKGPNVNFIVSQLGFAAEDAAVSFGTTGLAGALRGASNNLSVVAMAFNPIAGIIVGVGTALAASLIPMLGKTSEKTKQLADDMTILGQKARRAYIDLQEGRDGRGPQDVEPVVPIDLDRFQSQRKSFGIELDAAEKRIAHFQRETGFALGAFQQSLPTELSQGFLADPAGTYDFDLSRAQEVMRNKLSEGLQESIEEGSVLPLEKSAKFVRDYATSLSNVTGHGLESILPSESFKAVTQDLFNIARESITAREEIDKINESLVKLGKNEGIAKGAQSLVDALSPVFQVGGRFGDRFQSLFDAARTEFGGVGVSDRLRALQESDPLQAGYQFGSIEAVSAINRATFARPDPVDKNIEKNTSKTVDAVIGVAREVKHMKTAVVSAVTNSIKVGAGL